MDSQNASLDGPQGDDLSALAWVHGELRRSLEAAHKALRRYLKDAENLAGGDIDAVDPSVLRGARTQLHQGVGALELVGLPAVADVLRASESAVQRMIAKPALANAAAVEVIERSSFALLDYLTRLLARKPVSPVMLFPQYRAALALAGADRVHPADLWKADWQWLDLPPDLGATPLGSDDAARGVMETEVLTLLRTPGRPALRRMSDLCADLAAGARAQGAAQLATLWQLAAAVFEAQGAGLLQPDLYTKRIASRLLAQLRTSAMGQPELSDRLAQDLLFFCTHAKAPSDPDQAPRLGEVRQVWRLPEQEQGDYETARLGRFDPAHLAQARKRVAAAKDSWSAVAGGEQHRISGLAEQFALVGESLNKLFPSGDVLSRALQATVAQTVSSGQSPPAPLAMEVATGILYLDASLEDGELDQPELASRVERLAERIDQVRAGAEPQPLDIWMEELYRRVSDRQTMGSVVQELRASLSEIEKQIDQYFRNPAERQLLFPVPAQLSSMRGVLSVLGMDQASQAALHMRDEVDALAQTEVEPQRAIQTGTFDRLADNLGALSFLIDMLSVQPQLAKSLFRFDPATGSLRAVMGQTERAQAFALADEAATGQAPVQVPLLDQARALGEAAARGDLGDPALGQEAERLAQQALAADQPELARLLGVAHSALLDNPDPQASQAARAEFAAAVAGWGVTAPEELPPTAPVPPPKPAPQGGTGLEDDPEMRDIFIEEAREVIADAHGAVGRLHDAPDSALYMTVVRRAFHTLKGSSRMVGLQDFGDAAWACEQLFNARLAQGPHMDPVLRGFTSDALVYLGDWAEAIAAGREGGHQAAVLARAADALRLEDTRLAIPLPGAAAESFDATTEFLIDLPTEPLPLDSAPEVPAEAPARLEPASGPGFEPEFELDLPALEDRPAAEPLLQRLPDLPSAADLELGLPEPRPEPAGEAEERFELDLGDFNEEPLPAAGLPDLALDAPSQLADLIEALPQTGVEAVELELDLDDLGIDFGTAEPPAPPSGEAPGAAPLELPMLAEDLAQAFPDIPTVEAPEALRAETPTQAGATEPVSEAPPAVDAEEAGSGSQAEAEEPVKVIGPLRISIPLFNIYLNEADEQSRRLVTELAEWSVENDRHPVSETAVALAHSLAGNSATVGYVDLSALARALEHALMRSRAAGHGRPGEAELFSATAEEIRRLLHQFAAGFLREVDPALLERLATHERLPIDLEERLSTEAEESGPVPLPLAFAGGQDDVLGDDIDAVDAVDHELFPIFEEEADELLPQLRSRLREWHAQPGNPAAPAACMRTLHTFKGGARLAGAMRLGEMAHRLETAVEDLGRQDGVQPAQLEPLLALADAMASAFEAIRRPSSGSTAAPAPEPMAAQPQAVAPDAAAPIAEQPGAEPEPEPPQAAAGAAALPPEAATEAEPVPAPAAAEVPAIDWGRFTPGADGSQAPAEADRAAAGSGAVVRVRAGLLDRMVNNAGEVSITRSRIDSTVQLLQGSLGDLTDSLERLRRQLRDIELQAETQISSRLEAAKVNAQAFDPLEMDRFTRFQELTRFMAESVNDVATLQRGLQRTLQSAEDELAAQARLTRDLQDDLLRTRMIEFESMADRLYRTVRQAAKETGKQVRLDIVGGGIEVDRGVLERMAGSFEHLLRNSVAHGVELPAERQRKGKDASGLITITVAQSGNEVAVEVADDGAGLDLPRIRQRGLERGLLATDSGAEPGEAELSQLIFEPGFSTAETVTELAGRGVGLDVVRAEVNAMGGRIETSSEAGRGTRLRLLLPLTTAVTQVVLLRCAATQVAVPSTLVELVRRVPSAELEAAYASGHLQYAGEAVPLFWLASLLGSGTRGATAGRTQGIVIVRSAAQRVAVHVDEIIGNQEVVVKNVGLQLSRLPGLVGLTLLPSGAVTLIYNPVALATVHASAARDGAAQGGPEPALPAPVEAGTVERAPMVMVVDDSLTVRRVTQRLLVREGYRVVTAKDGLDALERLAEERPAVLLSDIEMPRMDGFDLLRNVRADARLQGLPVIMITSRTAQKHRDYARELGADHYLGKPYSEEELLQLVARHVQAQAVH